MGLEELGGHGEQIETASPEPVAPTLSLPTMPRRRVDPLPAVAEMAEGGATMVTGRPK